MLRALKKEYVLASWFGEGNSRKREWHEADFWASVATCSSVQLEHEVHVGERGAVGLGAVGRCWGAPGVRHELLGPDKGFQLRGDYMAFSPECSCWKKESV